MQNIIIKNKKTSCVYSTILAVIFIQFLQYQIFFAAKLDFKIKDSEIMNQGKQYMKECSDIMVFRYFSETLLYPLEVSFEMSCFVHLS